MLGGKVSRARREGDGAKSNSSQTNLLKGILVNFKSTPILFLILTKHWKIISDIFTKHGIGIIKPILHIPNPISILISILI